MTIRAVLRNGHIQPLEPLPPDWTEGQALVVERPEAPIEAADLTARGEDLEAAIPRTPADEHKRFPFIGVGIILWAISAAPMFIGMSRAFRSTDGVARTGEIERWISISFHPVFQICALLAILCIVVGILRWLCGFRTKRERVA